MQQLFQQKVFGDFVDKQNQTQIEQRWQKFKTFLAKKEKIASWIETDYQDGFLEDIFENALGYISKTRSTNEQYTLEREKKNETNAQKADGALMVEGKVVAVIELKDLKTKDLDKKYNREVSAVSQAFGYLQNNNNAKYVIVSNFNELRFYFDKATVYEQFFLFELDYEGFARLHTLLSYESISKNLPLEMKEKSLNFEQDISNKLYKDYTAFRTHLFENVLKNNPQADKLFLLNATQKLIDRIVFILFGEDTDLLPKNTIGTIIQRQKEVKKLVKNFTLYDSYKVYFEAINAGDEDLDITMYNGGLFAHDAFLDALVIEDEVLDARAKILSAYNFGSDISVNILGHIFENSISELEEISAQLLENDFDKKQSKRKKDGVFYTPAYITEYIVQNTLGKLCEEKRESLFIGSETLVSPKNPKNPTKTEEQIKNNLLIYKEWLLNLKILDPACGSGAFLNQALEYLLKEHTRLQNDLALMGDLFAVYEVEKEVLEHNLYGVDINEGAVEIARLSLWLRTAKKGRPLTKLANKIKVGNSLIDDKTVVSNAFEWQAEFPEVFAQGGFDVVIGNPPYTYRNASIDKSYFQQHYMSTQGNYDLYKFFMEKTIHLVSHNGLIGMIVPNTFLSAESYSNLRQIIIDNTNIKEIYDLGLGVFSNVVVESVIYILSKQNIGNETNIKMQRTRNIDIDMPEKEYKINLLNSDNQSNEYNIYLSAEVKKIINKINIDFTKLSNICYVTVGINTGYIKDDLTSDFQKDTRYHKMLNGKNIGRYTVSWSGEWILYDKNFVKSFGDRGRSLPQEYIFSNDKILIQRTRRGLKRKLICYLDLDKYYNLNRLSNVVLTNEDFDIKYIYVLLNSELMDFYFNNVFNEYEVKPVHLSQLPIKILSLNMQQPFIQKADKMLELNKNLQETKQNFINELKLEKLTKKLQNFEELTFEEFVTEYTKALKLKFADKLAERNFKQEWQAIFENDKALTCKLKEEISTTDKEIDKMVYELYGLSDEEIKIVEGV